MNANVRHVEFSPPSEQPAIYWMKGHVSTEDFISLNSVIMEGVELQPSWIKRGWGTRKLYGIGIDLSDSPLENFEPLTYWIPADHMEVAP